MTIRGISYPFVQQRLVLLYASAGRLEEARELLPDLVEFGMAEDFSRVYFDWDDAEKRLRPKLERMRAGGALGQVVGQGKCLGWLLRLKGDEEKADKLLTN